VRDRKDGGAAQECTDTRPYSERLAEQLTDKDWSELFLYYRRYKATISEDIEDIDSIEADFKDHTQGNLVSYKSILPLATPIAISNEGPSYLIGYDLYCPTPKCDCHSATLSVANLDEGSVHITEENSTTITVDFKKRKLKYVESRSENKNLPNPKEIISIINEQGDEIWDSLETRYNNVRRMYQNYLKRSGDKSNVSTVLPETKVKRNEPCPCGSGKKYKKCCLLAAV